VKDKKERVANMVFTLDKLIMSDRNSDPLSEGLIDKVQRLMNKWKQKNENFEELYHEGASIVREINEHHNRQKQLKLSNSEYSVLLILEEKWNEENLVEDARLLIKNLSDGRLIFPGCFQQKAIIKEIEKEVRRFIRKNYVMRYKIGLAEIDKLTSKIIEKLKSHETK
jgi:type I restriction enzyme, R subunit